MKNGLRTLALAALVAIPACSREKDRKAPEGAKPPETPPDAKAEKPPETPPEPVVATVPTPGPGEVKPPETPVTVLLPRPDPVPLDFEHLPDRPWLPKEPLKVPAVRPEEKRSAAEKALRKGVAYLQSIGTKAEYEKVGKVIGWAQWYTGDFKRRAGEAGQPIPPDVVLIGRCAAPTGTSLLTAYRATGDPEVLELAKQLGNLLVAGASPWGGWHQEMWIGPKRARGIHVYPGFNQWPDQKEERGTDSATFDDNTTTPEAEFLYRLWWTTKDPKWYQAWIRTMDFIVLAQKWRGDRGYPQGFPQGSYHAYSTFNDGVMNHCFDAMLTAYRRTGDAKYRDSVIRCADWIASVKKPGQGWATQYDGDKIGGARKFEPPGLGPDATVDAMGILKTAYEFTGEPKYLEAMVDAGAWLEKSQISPGRWARYYNPETNQPWYRNDAGSDVPDPSHAHGGYAWQGGWGGAGIKLAEQVKSLGKKEPQPAPPEHGDPSFQADWLPANRGGRDVEGIIASMNDKGGWYSSKGGRKGKKSKGGSDDLSRLMVRMSDICSHLNALSYAVMAEREKE